MLLVCQKDHAATSAQIAAAWRRPGTITLSIWQRLMEAVHRHDDGWTETDRGPTLDRRGRPHDFKSIPTDRHTAVWQCGVDLAAADDLYVALLIALHARWLYTHVKQSELEDQEIAQAFVEQITLRADELIHQMSLGTCEERTAVEPGPLSTARRLLGFFDALSLALIGAIAWFDQTDVLAFADERARLSMRRDDPAGHDGCVWIGPWPIEADRLDLSTRAVRLPRGRVADADELAQLLDRSSAIDLNWRLVSA